MAGWKNLCSASLKTDRLIWPCLAGERGPDGRGKWPYAMIGHAKPCPGLLEFLQILKSRQIRIGIGTDMTASIQYKKLRKLGLAPFIDFIVTSQEAGVEKPHPHFFDVCLEKAGCLPEECAFIGDNRKKDVQEEFINN